MPGRELHRSSHDLLELIVNRQLLVVPLDPDETWFRYHSILSAYLRHRLEAEVGCEEIATLHRRASHWYAAQELWTEAVQHAIGAGDRDQAVTWIKNCAMALVKKGDLLTLLGWQRLFSMVHIPTESKIAIVLGMALAIRIEDALQLLSQIESDLDNVRFPEKASLARECATIRSVVLALSDDSQAALALAQDCLTRTNDPWTANVASNVVRFGCLKAGDLTNFYATPWIAYSPDESRRNVFASVYRRCLQGLAELQQSETCPPRDAHYLDAVALAEEHAGPNSVATSLPLSLLAAIRYERGQMEEAEGMLYDRLPIVSATAMLDCVLSAYFVLERLAVSRENPSRAYTLLEQAENLGRTRGWGRLVAAVLFERVRLSCREGRISESVACLGRLEHIVGENPAPQPCAWSDIHRYAAWARAHIALSKGDLADATSILATLRDEAGATNEFLYFGLRVNTHLAMAYLRAGSHTDALVALRKVLSVGSQVGLYQTILDQGGDEFGPMLVNIRTQLCALRVLRVLFCIWIA